MAWFKRDREADRGAGREIEPGARGPLGEVPGLRQAIYNKDLAANLSVCPKCAHHFRLGAADRLRILFDDGLGRARRRAALDRPARVHRHQALHAAPKASGQRPASRTPSSRHRRHRRHRDVGRGDGVRLHRRQHGRGRRREDHARHRARASRRQPVVIVSLLGRRADDGRRALADADGQGQRPRWRGSIARGCRTSRCSPTRRPAASPPASRCSAT